MGAEVLVYEDAVQIISREKRDESVGAKKVKYLDTGRGLFIHFI
jgi:hypothetical protein